MHDCRPFRIAVCADRCKKCCDTRSYILPKQYKCCTVQCNNSAGSKSLQNSYGSRRRLDDCRKDHSGKDSQNRIFKTCQKPNKFLRFTERCHRGTHHIHTNKKDSKTCNNISDVVDSFIFQKYQYCYTYKGDKWSQHPYI